MHPDITTHLAKKVDGAATRGALKVTPRLFPYCSPPFRWNSPGSVPATPKCEDLWKKQLRNSMGGGSADKPTIEYESSRVCVPVKQLSNAIMREFVCGRTTTAMQKRTFSPLFSLA